MGGEDGVSGWDGFDLRKGDWEASGSAGSDDGWPGHGGNNGAGDDCTSSASGAGFNGRELVAGGWGPARGGELA